MPVGRGSVSAGRVLEWIDKAGYAAEPGWSGTYAVTAYVGNVRFTRPVRVGELVEVTARVVHTGRTSMHITVDVASGQPHTRELEPATRCLMVFVSVDAQGSSTPVRELVPRTLGEELEQQWAARRADLRRAVEEGGTRQVFAVPRVGTSRRHALPRGPDRRQLGRQGPRWHRHALDRRGGPHVLATRWTGNPHNVAIFTGGVRFYRPLRIGHVVEVEARLLHTGTTAMHIGVHVRSACRAPGADGMELTTFCRTVFVGIDDERRAV